MTFLPIVDRELRVAARKRSTFWLRVIAALVALVLGLGFMCVSLLSGIGTAGLGKGLFAVLTWLSLAAALCAGLFFTSDCLSEEKRDGTLGFLFLTDLRGYDVVLGKLLATSLRGCFALLAVFPILAVTVLMGGVAGPEFWKTMLALVNALFCSLAVGLLVSAISRDPQRAMGGTLFVLSLLLAGAPVVDVTIAGVRHHGFEPIFSLGSPGYLFLAAGRWHDPTFWSGLAISLVISAMSLAFAAVLVPKTWQDRRTKSSGSQKNWAYVWKYGGAGRRAALRRKLMSRSPMLWLACRERWQSFTLWVAVLGMVAVCAGVLVSGMPEELWIAWGTIGGALSLLFYLGTASQAGRFFLEARRSGLVELLLAAPLGGKEIVQGQWRALLRMFGLPLALFLVPQIGGTFLANQVTWGRMAAVTAAAPGTPASGSTTNGLSVTNASRGYARGNVSVVVSSRGVGTSGITTGAFGVRETLASLAAAVVGTLTFIANLAALSWFGMWMGLTSRNNNFATLKTLVFVQVIPWFVISFASVFVFTLVLIPALMSATAEGAQPNPAGMMVWYPLVTAGAVCVLSLVKDVFFVSLARRKLYSDFRALAVKAIAPIQAAVPPALPRTEATPPLPARPA